MNLSDRMEFDHVIRVHADGTVTDEPGIYAPTLLDEQLDSPKWTLFTKGYSGQYSYNGPVMHNSEYIGGGLARDILAEPGVYVAIVADWSADDDQEKDTIEGWAIARLIDPTN
jgi:hypothetical protein